MDAQQFKVVMDHSLRTSDAYYNRLRKDDDQEDGDADTDSEEE